VNVSDQSGVMSMGQVEFFFPFSFFGAKKPSKNST
jgi:hypothetical protein